MVPVWFKKSLLYGALRTGRAALVRALLRTEYALFAPSKRKDELLASSSMVPKSNGSRFYTRLPFYVGVIADQFLYENYAHTCRMVPLTPDNWLEARPGLACALVTSGWSGLSGEWRGVSTPGSEVGGQLCRLMEESARRGCPVLFYSKEDPPNFHCFVQYAKYADHIYTSAQECVEAYQAACPGIPVDVMHFAISPELHNPVGMKPLSQIKDRAFFAGSWMKKYPARVEMQGKLFDWVRRSGLTLEIADRNYSRYSRRYCYPLRYLSSVLPEFTYEQISALYKDFGWILNLNSVQDSMDMFSLRVYDALACGGLVLSNESMGMEEIFPQVFVIRSQEQLQQVLDTPLEQLEKLRLEGIRQVFRQGTTYEKMEQMLHSVGLCASCKGNDRVGVILSDDIPDRALCLEQFEAQTYQNKILISSPTDWEAIDRCGMIALWGADRRYERHYLEDMVNAFKYTACDYVTKPDAAEAFHCYTDEVNDVYATLFSSDAYRTLRPACPSHPFRLANGYRPDGASYEKQPSAQQEKSNIGVLI